MFIGLNEKPGSIPVGNVCYFVRFYIKSLLDLGNYPIQPINIYSLRKFFGGGCIVTFFLSLDSFF
ncbi:MAG: hypothetical protein RIR11_1657 [Bacteroidota bacterium]|jgi:hypothetical protein